MVLTLTCIAWLVVMVSRVAGENNLTALFHEALTNDGSLQSSVGVSGAMSDLELVYLRRHPTTALPTIVLNARDKRSGSGDRLGYAFDAFGRKYNLRLEKMAHLVSPRAKMTVVGPRGGVSITAISPSSCHYIHVDEDITAALSACKPGTIAGYVVSRNVTLEVRPLGKRAAGKLHHALRKRGASGVARQGIPHVVRRIVKDAQARPSPPTHMELEIPPPACSEPISNATPDDMEFGQGEIFTIPSAETTPTTPLNSGSFPVNGPDDLLPIEPPGLPLEEDPVGVFFPPLPTFKRTPEERGDSLNDREPKPMQGFDREPKPIDFDSTQRPPAEDREPKPMQGFDREPRPMNRVLRGPPSMDRDPKPMQGFDREPKPMREPGQEIDSDEGNREPKPMQGFDREPRPMNRVLRGSPSMDRDPKPMQGFDREPKPMREPGQEIDSDEGNREPKPMQGFDREPRPMNRSPRGPTGMDREPKPMQGFDREPKPMGEPGQEPESPDEGNREPKPMQGFDREPRPMNRVPRGPTGMDREPKPMQGFDREPKPMGEPGQDLGSSDAGMDREPKPMQGFDREPRPMNRVLRGPTRMDREPKPMQGFDREPKPMGEPGQEPETPETELNREPKPMQGFDREPRVAHKKRNSGKTVELGVFVDQAAHDLFLPYLGSQTALTDVILGYVNGIQALFHHPSLGQKIHLVINYIEVMTEQPSDLPHYGGDREKLYESFRLYNERKNKNTVNMVDTKAWDMGILISGLNFYSVHKKDGRTSYSTMGLAAVRGVCHPDYSAVIVELGATDTWGKPYPSAGFASVYVMAHEMGHNLGMLHDGYGNSCPKNGYVMSASRSTSGETNWSSCSREIVETLSDATRRLRKLVSQKRLRDVRLEVHQRRNELVFVFEGDRRDAVHDHSTHDQSYPARPGDAYDQCRVFLRDNDATLYNESLAQLQSVCNTVMCRSPHRIGYFKAGPALDGTYCGSESWCVAGSCTPWPASKAPVVVLGGWGAWQHTSCTSGCIHNSTGVQVSKRSCSNPKPHNTDKRCPGVDTTVNLCDDSQLCDGVRVSITEYADRKCEEFSQVVSDLKPIGAMAPHNPGRQWQACAVFCQRSSGTWYSPRTDLSHLPHFDTYFPDGTLCHADAKHMYYCQRHQCLPKGVRQAKELHEPDPEWDVHVYQNAPPRPSNNTVPEEVAKIFELSQNMDPLMSEPLDLYHVEDEELWIDDDYLHV
ncbi:uncharacterized protein LOC122247686 [Penaeus japonicus]|uniref:uncharacterized protein LOC122247686 n=1 Tax=Penaeus japonicus TaxID=27405 RepID=UPI001C70EFC0|nr:uncharacterized protein LOC122247686 [Penaeus japonicus]